MFYNDLPNCSRFLSENSNSNILSCQIYDGDVWLTYLYQNGKEITKYLSIPELLDESKENWQCKYSEIASAFCIPSDSIKNYFHDVGKESLAYPNDKYSNNDANQLSDFLDKLDSSL